MSTNPNPPNPHSHSHTETKQVLHRLSRASGHLDAVRKMVEEGQNCSDVLIQLSAVISALNRAGKVLLLDHLKHCVTDAEEGPGAWEEVEDALDKFFR